MQVLITARGYPTNKFRMNGIFEFDQAKALAKAGVDVIYAAVDVRSLLRWRKWGFEEKIIDDVRIFAINIPCGRIPMKLYEWITEKALRRLYSRIVSKCGRPDIIHSHFLNFGYITVHALKEKGIPIVHTEHFSVMNQDQLDEHTQFLGDRTYHKVDQVIAVSQALKESIKEKFRIDAMIIPNIVDTTVFTYLPEQRSDDEFCFISVGGLIGRKRMDQLISTFHEVFSEKPEVKLFIFGEGPEKGNLERMIERLGLSGRVFLLGLTDRKIIARKMNESHCFVLASQLETFGVAFIEALACGLPVIATKSGGPEGFIDDKNGILIPVNNAERLAEAMKTMYLNIKKYDRFAIAEEIKAYFSPEAVAKNIIGVYQRLLDTGKLEK